MHHLVARVGGEPVGCARVRLMADTAYLGAVTVLPAWQGKGLGAALTIAAGELAAQYSDLVWLHCTPGSRGLYERLGYRHVDDHALLVPVPRPVLTSALPAGRPRRRRLPVVGQRAPFAGSGGRQRSCDARAVTSPEADDRVLASTRAVAWFITPFLVAWVYLRNRGHDAAADDADRCCRC